ncbi:amino acid ABC transporter ATP-binding protein [Pseudomonas putida]
MTVCADAPVVLRVDALRKDFGDVAVLKGIDLKVQRGEVISLIGSSGSGKSTFLRCLNFLETPTSGAIEINGRGLYIETGSDGRTRLSNPRLVDQYRTEVGMVFQSFNLWPHRTVLENVTEALIWVKKVPKAAARAQAMEVLARVGLDHKHAEYPQALSGGQQQRVAIARALAMKPGIMLFDEPTSALDPELVGEVLRVIRQLAEEGNTILLVTHEMRFAREVSSRILFLHQGVIEDDGTPEHIFNHSRSERVRQFVSQHC